MLLSPEHFKHYTSWVHDTVSTQRVSPRHTLAADDVNVQPATCSLSDRHIKCSRCIYGMKERINRRSCDSKHHLQHHMLHQASPAVPRLTAMRMPTVNSQSTSWMPPWISRNLRPNLQQQQQWGRWQQQQRRHQRMSAAGLMGCADAGSTRPYACMKNFVWKQ
jgi:hypothetical protein